MKYLRIIIVLSVVGLLTPVLAEGGVPLILAANESVLSAVRSNSDSLIIESRTLPPINVGAVCTYEVKSFGLVTVESHRIAAVNQGVNTLEIVADGKLIGRRGILFNGNSYSNQYKSVFQRFRYPLKTGKIWPYEYRKKNRLGEDFVVRFTATVVDVRWQVVRALSSSPVRVVEIKYTGYSDEDFPGEVIRHASTYMEDRVVYAPDYRCVVLSRLVAPHLDRTQTLTGYSSSSQD